MQIQQQKYSERAQLVHDNKTGHYLNYRQLIKEPKHKEIWSTSAANKFGSLAQGVGGRVVGGMRSGQSRYSYLSVDLTLVLIGPPRPNRLGVTISVSTPIAIRRSPNFYE